MTIQLNPTNDEFQAHSTALLPKVNHGLQHRHKQTVGQCSQIRGKRGKLQKQHGINLAAFVYTNPSLALPVVLPQLMKIIGLDARLPSRSVSNDEVLALIEQYSKDEFQGDLPRTLEVIKRLLHKAGIENRYWLSEGESPLTLLKTSFEKALQEADIPKDAIDLVLFTGVARGCTLASNAAWVAQTLDLQCQTFDVLDACMGWVSSMEVVNDLMASDQIQYAAIINMEFNMIEGDHIFPKNFKLKKSDEINYKFSSFTIGEMLSVVILSNNHKENFKFNFINRPDLSEICTISLPGWQTFSKPSDKISVESDYQFTSFSKIISHVSDKEAINVFNLSLQNVNEGDYGLLVGHTFSGERMQKWSNLVGWGKIFYPVAQTTGNLVSGSIPFALNQALLKGKFSKNKHGIGWNGSAGMSFSVMTFCF